jgi:hypothetical protein
LKYWNICPGFVTFFTNCIFDGSVRLTGNNKVYEHLNDAVLDSLCPKDSGEIFHMAECLNRNCSECGVEKLD